MSKTKKTVIVTITKEIEIEIDNSRLTPEALKEFSECFYSTFDPDDMFRLAAGQIANYEPSFVEGLGSCRPYYDKDGAIVIYDVTDETTECEIQ